MNTLWALMNDPARATLWAALQAELLVLSAILVGWYLLETRRMRKAAENQVRESQNQIEAQTRPVITVFVRGSVYGLELHNVGTGPAFGVILSATERESNGKPDLDRLQNDISFIEPGQKFPTGIRPVTIPGFTTPGATSAGAIPVLNGRSLQCQYKSLSGRTYWTVVDFDKASGTTVIDTRFSGGHILPRKEKSPV